MKKRALKNSPKLLSNKKVTLFFHPFSCSFSTIIPTNPFIKLNGHFDIFHQYHGIFIGARRALFVGCYHICFSIYIFY